MKYLVFFLSMVFAAQAFGNAAQPGIWNAGGAGAFFPLFPGDSAAFQVVQMVQEQVKIHLYPGFAVVKGVYQMHNPSGDTVLMRVGYPVNSSYDASPDGQLAEVRFDDLYDLRARVRGIPQQVEKAGEEFDGWYVWNAVFPPGAITTLEVDFIVNTNDAFILRGYDRRVANAFIYLIESGATWLQPIGKGTILVQMMGGLTLADINGAAPSDMFEANEAQNLLVWRFENLSPSAADNPVITYGKRLDDFDFAAVLARSSEYYRALGALSHQGLDTLSLEPHSFSDPFHVGSSVGSVMVGVGFFLAMFGVPLLLVLASLGMGWYFYRRWRRGEVKNS